MAPTHCQLDMMACLQYLHLRPFEATEKSSFLTTSFESSRFPAGSSSPADMECGGGELSDSGSSGYWSWDHGNVSPAPSPSVTEVDSSPDEGLHMELEQAEELNAKKPKVRRHVPLNDCSVCLALYHLSGTSPVLCSLSLTELFQRCV